MFLFNVNITKNIIITKTNIFQNLSKKRELNQNKKEKIYIIDKT